MITDFWEKTKLTSLVFRQYTHSVYGCQLSDQPDQEMRSRCQRRMGRGIGKACPPPQPTRESREVS